MRLIRRLFLLLVVLWVVAEIAGPPVANRIIEQRVAERTEGATTVDAHIGSFPVVARLALTGVVSKLTVTLDSVVRQRLTYGEIRFDVRGVHMDRGALLQRKVRVTDIDGGTVRATLDIGELSPAAARVLSRTGVRVSGRTLVVGGASFALSSDLLPCTPQAGIVGEQIVLTCTFNEVPPALVGATEL